MLIHIYVTTLHVLFSLVGHKHTLIAILLLARALILKTTSQNSSFIKMYAVKMIMTNPWPGLPFEKKLVTAEGQPDWALK